jgi:hypothetical protein
MSDSAPLLYDRQAAIVEPDPLAIQAWGAGQRIFVSSLIASMTEERAAVRRAIQGVGALPRMFEHDLGAQDVNAESAYLDGVRESSMYVGVFGSKYGVRLASGRSATHDELTEAERLGLRLLLFVDSRAGDAMDGDQRSVISGLQNLYTTSPYSSDVDLGDRVHRRLIDLAAEELIPWVRIGRLLIRANRISRNGDDLGVSALVWDRPILAELTRLADSRSTVPFASHLEAADVQVGNLVTNATNSAYVEVTLKLRRLQSRSGGLGRMSVNGIGPDELASGALSDGLFGTSTLPSGWGFGAQRVNPLAPLQGAHLPDTALRPISRLLLTEHLLREQHADAVTGFVLGPAHQGKRRLRLTWLPPRAYSNSPDALPQTIEGDLLGL